MICAFVFAHAESWFSDDSAQMTFQVVATYWIVLVYQYKSVTSVILCLTNFSELTFIDQTAAGPSVDIEVSLSISKSQFTP